jgi:choline dehydrogenase
LPYRFGPTERARFRTSGSGALASNLAEVGALLGQIAVPGAPADEAAATPRFQLHVTPTHYLKYPWLRSATNCMSIAITPLHPASRGRLAITGAASAAQLKIEPRYLAESGDLEEFVAACSWVAEVVGTSSLQPLIARQLIPAEHRRDAAGIRRSVRSLAQSIYHPVGTCRAGLDAGSVVDDEFRVRGAVGLRVADASVLPDLPSANTCAATLVMAELAARSLLNTSRAVERRDA